MQYAFDGVEDMGVDVSIYGERAVVTINCRLQHFGPYYNEPGSHLMMKMTRMIRKLSLILRQMIHCCL